MGKMGNAIASWWKEDGYLIFLSADVIAGTLAAAVLIVVLYFAPSTSGGTGLLSTEAVVGGAVLAVCLTALAILVAFLGDDYIALLEKSVTIKRALLPYQVVATISATSVIAALVSILAWGFSKSWGHIFSIATVSGLSISAVIGTVQIVNLTVRHGVRKARLTDEIRRAARSAVSEK
jgi:hypothetical protein